MILIQGIIKASKKMTAGTQKIMWMRLFILPDGLLTGSLAMVGRVLVRTFGATANQSCTDMCK